MAGIFGDGGLLAKRHPGYEFRRSQLEMAEIIAEAFDKHQHALIEAGTGTGKTLAYLIPAIQSGTARRDFDGNEIASGAALQQGRAVPPEIFRAGFESGADEGPQQFSLPAEAST